MLTEQDIQKQRQLNLLDGDLPALRCLNQDYKGDLSDLLWDLDFYAKLPEAKRALNALDTDEHYLIAKVCIDWPIECIQTKLDQLNSDIDGELIGCIDCLEQESPDLESVVRYLKQLRKSNEKSFNEIDEKLEHLFKTDD